MGDGVGAVTLNFAGVGGVQAIQDREQHIYSRNEVSRIVINEIFGLVEGKPKFAFEDIALIECIEDFKRTGKHFLADAFIEREDINVLVEPESIAGLNTVGDLIDYICSKGVPRNKSVQVVVSEILGLENNLLILEGCSLGDFINLNSLNKASLVDAIEESFSDNRVIVGESKISGTTTVKDLIDYVHGMVKAVK